VTEILSLFFLRRNRRLVSGGIPAWSPTMTALNRPTHGIIALVFGTVMLLFAAIGSGDWPLVYRTAHRRP